jgi:hypothetical protein
MRADENWPRLSNWKRQSGLSRICVDGFVILFTQRRLEPGFSPNTTELRWRSQSDRITRVIRTDVIEIPWPPYVAE